MSTSPPTAKAHWSRHWHALRVGAVRYFHAYGNWLVSISWWRFFLISILVMLLAGITYALLDLKLARVPIIQYRNEVVKNPKPTPSLRIDDTRVQHDEWVSFSLESDRLGNLVMLLIVASLILKITYRGRIQAEAVAAAATQVAETESLKRQVMEARMAAMQAQMEPHFLFNTLAGIEHLIETDPPRAATMQKSLIAFLRATMPTLREANAQAERDLGRELAVVQPYLELMRMRMEERLQFDLEVPQGLRSARFPPMMLQSLVENAIRHGLEPKAEGGSIIVRAEVQDGQLIVQVQDTGVGFAPSAPGASTGAEGGGIGLSNIRARLQLLYSAKATLQTSSPSTGGACVTITVPYQLGAP